MSEPEVKRLWKLRDRLRRLERLHRRVLDGDLEAAEQILGMPIPRHRGTLGRTAPLCTPCDCRRAREGPQGRRVLTVSLVPDPATC